MRAAGMCVFDISPAVLLLFLCCVAVLSGWPQQPFLQEHSPVESAAVTNQPTNQPANHNIVENTIIMYTTIQVYRAR